MDTQSLHKVDQSEDLIIRRAYRRLLRSIKSPRSKDDQIKIRAAYEMAVEAHRQQRRKSGEPYILHPIEVARICANEIGLGPTAVICALLHDVVEDTDVGLKDIEKTFGKKITRIVDGLTKLDGAYIADSPQAENFKKVLSTLVEDVRVVLIKMADRLHNLRTIGSMPKHKQLRIAAETAYIYTPLAHRLGLYNLKTEFQDLCMKITEPEIYRNIAVKLHETKKDRQRYISTFIKPLKDKLKKTRVTYRIHGRPKSIYSIWNKIKTKQVPFEEIYDLFAIRIIVDVPFAREKQVCWQIYSIVTDVFNPIPERLKDWVTTPKSNGYESLHTTVIGPKGQFVEVQIRSERMDEIAERGFAAHWKYKGIKNSEDENVYETWLNNIREILEQNKHSDAIEFLTDFKTNLFNEEVYVYTPRGDMKILPKGATALDFAFSIHTDVGYHATAIKVNNKLVPMGYKLTNGDQVSVVTNKNQKPSDTWLKMVVTGKARSKIRSALKEERRQQGVFGKEALERKFKNLKVDFEKNVDKVVKHFGFRHRPDLYFALASDEIQIRDITRDFEVDDHQLKLKPKDAEPKTDVEKPARGKTRGESSRQSKVVFQPKLLINDEPGEQYNYSFANCCRPLPGDEIFAYLTAGAGLKIHRNNCPNATHLMAHYGYRMMRAQWVHAGKEAYIVELRVTGIDDGPGVIERLTNSISTELGLNIRSLQIEGNGGYFEGKISLQVINKDQMNLVIRSLKKLEGISVVTRIT